MAENIIERYLSDLAEIRGTRANVPETSFYPALERLLSDIDLDLTAGWGHGGKGGVTMPGKGRITRREVDGQTVLDVHVNADACWRHIPGAVWDYTIGGYPVLKKWLSYREKPLLGRGLTPAEIRHITETARRLAALLALHGALDANYTASTRFHKL